MPRGLDHLVLATHDLDRQAALYSALGFSVGRRNRHPWGTLNHIVQFPGCFLELIGLETGFAPPDESEPVAAFAGFLSRYLAEGEGFAMLVLESRDAEADQNDFAAAGIAARPSTFFFERKGSRPDGSEVHVAFTLAFARSPQIAAAGFFVCQQHFPENFWNAPLQRHENGVGGVTAAVMMAEDPIRHAAFLEAYTGGGRVTRHEGGIAVATPRGAIEMLTPAAVAAAYGAGAAGGRSGDVRFVAIEFAGGDVAEIGRRAAANGVACQERDGRIVVPAEQAFGVALGFGRR